MNLPNYFIADLPAEASLSAVMVEEACRTLKRNREQFLSRRSTADMVELLSAVGSNWLKNNYPLRVHTLTHGPGIAGFSRATLCRGIDTFFGEFTKEGFRRLLEQDLGDVARLDQFCSSAPEERGGRYSIANGPAFLVHIAAGNLPNPAWMSMTLGIIMRSAQFVKCARGGAFLPRMFAHSIYEADPKAGACLELAEWAGGNTGLEAVLFAEADCVTITGSDETLTAVRSRAGLQTRVVTYGSKLSFAYVSAEVLSGVMLKTVLRNVAADIAAWNQLGCLSPHVIYVEQGGMVSPEAFAELLSGQLQEVEAEEPRGELPVHAAAAIASRRSIYTLRAANDPGTRLWASAGSTAWTVVYEEDPRFQASCLNRFVYVKPVPDFQAALEAADEVRKSVSTIALAVPGHKRKSLALVAGRWGASRVCPVGSMQNPPLSWRHDGRPALGELVTWTDWEPEP